MSPTRAAVLSALWIAALVAVTIDAQQAAPAPGDPLPGLSPASYEAFRVGLNSFKEVETVDEGLGPAFNGTSCAVCHSVPAVGGISPMTEVRAGRREADGRFTALDPDGNTLLHTFSLPDHQCQPALPEYANVIARRMPLPIFGDGLIEAIPDEAILALEDPIDRNRDGVRGRASIVVDRASGERRVGRFGWKAQIATLLTFSAGAYRDEMGITNELFATELASGMDAERMKRCDAAADPEDRRDPRTSRRDIDNFAEFMKFLAPIARGPVTDVVRSGDLVFASIGCAACHVPALTTGPSADPVFNRKTVPLYSDLLLHAIGTGDGIVQADSTATGEEIRTPPLWGLRLRRPLLHDGSAATIEDAIGRHAGEAALAREGFQRLDEASRAALLAFLRSL